MHEHDEHTASIHTHLRINGLDVFDELTDAKLHYEGDNYYEFGYSIGYVLEQITLQQRIDNTLPVGWRDNALQCPSEQKQSF